MFLLGKVGLAVPFCFGRVRCDQVEAQLSETTEKNPADFQKRDNLRITLGIGETANGKLLSEQPKA